MMMRLCLAALLLVFSLHSCQQKKAPILTIATAANLQFAISELTEAFTLKTRIPCQSIVSSSGKLNAQIREGAPFDVFVSADMKYPMDLYQANLTDSIPQIYAFGKLVLWTQKSGLNPGLELLTKEKINHIALANPKTAPYGAAAMQVLEHFHLAEKIKEKLVFGESISQTNQFINSGVAEIGFTSMSVVLSPQVKGEGKWAAIDLDAYSPIAQGIVVLKNSSKGTIEGRKFKEFLLSAEGSQILDKFGYSSTK